MTDIGIPDSLSIVNGPEDGSTFAILRSPFTIGRDSTCAVHVLLDTAVQLEHARLAVVSDGYRVRSVAGAPVFVGGKRAGVVRSRILTSGKILRIGNTELVLQCASGGLASRSRGIAAENDIVWLFRRSAARMRVRLWLLSRWLLALPRVLLSRGKLALMGVFVVCFVLFPGFRTAVWGLFFRIRSAVFTIIDQISQ